jgi:hypothetical protein
MRKIHFILIILCFARSICFAQFYFEPRIGISNALSKRIEGSPDLKNRYQTSYYQGIELGKKSNSLEYALGYLHYTSGITFDLRNEDRVSVGWGSAYLAHHNFYYGMNYILFQKKRSTLSAGLTLSLSQTRLTFGSTEMLPLTHHYANNILEGLLTIKAYEKRQFLVEPKLNFDVKINKRITWETQLGYTFGHKTLYRAEANYSINNIPEPKGVVTTNGTAIMFGTGLKMYASPPKKDVKGEKIPYKNVLHYSSSSVFMPKYKNFNHRFDLLLEVGYQRFINKKQSIGFNLSIWGNRGYVGLYETYLENPTTIVSEHSSRYKFADLYLSNSLLNKKHHFISWQIGVSASLGRKSISSGVYYDGIPDIVFNFRNASKEQHLGLNTGVNYSYSFLKDRFFLGLNGKCTYFPNSFLQLSYGFRVGYCFQ